MILGIDPGRKKCGLAIMDFEENVLAQEVVTRTELTKRINSLAVEYTLHSLVIGDGTLAEEIIDSLESQLNFEIKIITVDESYSTLEARELYWQHNPRRGWRKLLPISLQTPPREIDDYAAIILIKRFIAQN
ncbi:Holliday junction resolvase RuvX [Fuchsiella alkaliacetigena]|uniref:Holliday junction resolvase RuvX n=1 Tax=Fuchsiella alkaliacetigena TaxID=957042 RepID=UPI00200B537C|nr:Holliday junction resolvase RuvX [Fuchsiella alkaliacetigena]MCK8824287.1 Holliday junction resolvase RuvX [Fuchsiella alkaliacetigena]